ncbi:MAG: tRNA uridine-5-carboxymethylaminomethyl(34) synthesis GTPase MnmE [Clostridiales bacterium]|nr:tRNA uridine-5-carboxymethylaminomethyl(34) synthesis GTPase MnmE [Clostridiales bacterium]
MNQLLNDTTIAAIATPPGTGGIAIIRLSGEKALFVLKEIFTPKGKDHSFQSHLMTYGYIMKQEEILDEVMAVFMKSPRTYTKEDVVEIYCHGGSVVAQRVLDLALTKGATLAQPGEFTKRAFLNGRIDLSQAEAVMDVISASGKKAAQIALRQLSGGTSQFITQAQQDLFQLAAGLEAAIDYPEEVEEQEAVATLESGLRQLAQEIEDACDMRSGKLLKEGMTVAICGRPNVGKSSLLNALTKEEHAIVTDVPGTTRDIITASLEIEGIFVRLYDTAGIRESEDMVESIGIQKAKSIMEQADLLLLVIDASQPLTKEDYDLLSEYKEREMEIILHKGDLENAISAEEILHIAPKAAIHKASSRTGQGLREIRLLLKEKAMLPSQMVLTNQRHMQRAKEAADYLLQGAQALKGGAPLDMVGIDIRLANEALGEITGEDVSEKVLDAVFEQFCVGK